MINFSNPSTIIPQLCNTCLYGHLNIVKELVLQGADIHSLNELPLRNACIGNHLDIVKYLVEYGADIYAYDDEALKQTNTFRHLDVVKYLVSLYDPQYIVDKLPEFTQYITDPKYSHIVLSDRFGLFDE